MVETSKRMYPQLDDGVPTNFEVQFLWPKFARGKQ